MLVDTVDEFDWDRDFGRYEVSNPRVEEWQAMMEHFQEPVAEAGPDEWWARMEEVFRLNG